MAWFPEQLKNILNLDYLDITYIEENDFSNDRGKNLRKLILESKHVGLTTFNMDIPIDLVCLTLDCRILVFNLKYSKIKTFLKEQFENDKITFYTSNGSYNAKLFFDHMNLRLDHYSNIYDLTVLDLLINLNEIRNSNKNFLYTSELIYERKEPIQLSYEQLVKYRLKLDRLDLNCSNEELSALLNIPFNVLAKNCIMKRCSLTRELGIKFMEDFNERINDKYENIFSFAQRVPEELKTRYENECDGTYAQFCQLIQQCPKNDK